MAEFVEVMKQKERMCKKYSEEFSICKKCELGIAKTKHDMVCWEFLENLPQEAEEIIMKWAKEHPVITNFQKLEEVFGKELTDKLDINDCMMNRCPNPIRTCGECEYDDFWKQEYKEPKGE